MSSGTGSGARLAAVALLASLALLPVIALAQGAVTFDGERVWIYDEDLNQVVVRKVGDALGSTPAALLAGRDDVERAFTWKEAAAEGGFDWLVATPRAQDATFTEIRLGFAGSELAALDLVDAFGQRTAIRFGVMVPNAKFTPETFRFLPPKGADVIGDK